MTDVTDATFETAVLERSAEVTVVVDLWAPWCGPCKTLGPIIEEVVQATEGKVELVKVNVDENPRISASFQVQSIPAVFAIKDKTIVDNFIGALPKQSVENWVEGLLPMPSEADGMTMMGDEESLRGALEIEPGHVGAVVALVRILIDSDRKEEALQLLARIPETADVRHLLAEARTAGDDANSADIVAQLDALLPQLKADDDSRQRFLDLLELLGAGDPRTAEYRRQMATALF